MATMLTTGEVIALIGLLGTVGGVYAGARAEASRLAASFEAMAGAMRQIRDDVHEMRQELRGDLKVHSEQLGELSERVAIIETKVK
jgi:hypothetical protein